MAKKNWVKKNQKKIWTIGGLSSRFGEPDSNMKLKKKNRQFFFFCPIPRGGEVNGPTGEKS